MKKLEIKNTRYESLPVAIPVWVYSAAEAQAKVPYEYDPSGTLTMPSYALEREAFITHFEKDTKWAQYLKGCLRTWNHSNTFSEQIAHAALGAIGEVAEYIIEDEGGGFASDDNWLSEIGDVMYYRTMLAYLYGMDFELRVSTPDNKMFSIPDKKMLFLTQVQNMNMWIADVGKKAAFTGGIVKEKTIFRVKEGISLLDSIINTILSDSPMQLEEVLQFNLEKLQQRYEGGKFNSNLA